MCPFSAPDRHDLPWLSDEIVPGVAAMVDDIVVGSEDVVGQQVVAWNPLDVLDRIELGRT